MARHKYHNLNSFSEFNMLQNIATRMCTRLVLLRLCRNNGKMKSETTKHSWPGGLKVMRYLNCTYRLVRGFIFLERRAVGNEARARCYIWHNQRVCSCAHTHLEFVSHICLIFHFDTPSTTRTWPPPTQTTRPRRLLARSPVVHCGGIDQARLCARKRSASLSNQR